MSKPMVYLAGPIAGQTYDESVGWREWATAELGLYGISALSPMRAKNYLSSYNGKLDSKDGAPIMKDGYDEFPLSTDDAITARDRMDVMRSDLVLFHFPPGLDRVSIGTCIEFGWADAFRKPRVVSMSDDVHNHAMIRSLTDFKAKSVEEAVRIAVGILYV